MDVPRSPFQTRFTLLAAEFCLFFLSCYSRVTSKRIVLSPFLFVRRFCQRIVVPFVFGRFVLAKINTEHLRLRKEALSFNGATFEE